MIEVELVSSGERWGRGPSQRHSLEQSRRASTARRGIWCRRWPRSCRTRRQQARDRRLRRQGPPAVRGGEGNDPAKGHARLNEADAKKQLGVNAGCTTWTGSRRSSCSSRKPTVNIEGLVGGYTGPGGKTILPHRAVAKLDLRLVPDMTAAGALAALKAHLAKRGFGDIEVNMTGGYDPTSTPADAGCHPGAVHRVSACRDRPDPLAAQRRFVARLRVHRRSLAAPGGPFRPRPWQRRARAR